MADKEINVIIQNRHDTAENWGQSNYIPKEGEIIVYDNSRIKIGNNSATAEQLPFANTRYTLSGGGRTITLEGDGIGASSNTITLDDKDTTYDAGEGLTLDDTNTFSLTMTGVSADTYGEEQVITSHGDSFIVPSFRVDQYGRLTSAENVEITLPAETAVSIQPGTNSSENVLNFGDSFSVISGITSSGHTITRANTTYTITSNIDNGEL